MGTTATALTLCGVFWRTSAIPPSPAPGAILTPLGRQGTAGSGRPTLAMDSRPCRMATETRLRTTFSRRPKGSPSTDPQCFHQPKLLDVLGLQPQPLLPPQLLLLQPQREQLLPVRQTSSCQPGDERTIGAGLHSNKGNVSESVMTEGRTQTRPFLTGTPEG